VQKEAQKAKDTELKKKNVERKAKVGEREVCIKIHYG
jgi:hypothetical protein